MPKPPARDDKYNDNQKAMKTTLAKRLKGLRNSKGLSHEKLKQELQIKQNIEISKQALINYEVDDEYNTKFNAGFGMNITYLWVFAKYYNVSTDYLLGLTDCQSPDVNVQGVCEFTGLSQKVTELLSDWNKTPQCVGFIEIINDMLSDNDFFEILEMIDIFYNLYRLQDHTFANLTFSYTRQVAEAILAENKLKDNTALTSLYTGFDKDIFLTKAENQFIYMLRKIAFYKFESEGQEYGKY